MMVVEKAMRVLLKTTRKNKTREEETQRPVVEW
jgi:hypothetical protein